MRRLVIVGASLAGLRAAQSARAAGHDGGIVLIGQEPHLPYTRPPLSKEVLQGKHDGDQCAFPLADLDVHWLLGTAATELDRDNRRVKLADGSAVEYDRAILATGSRARVWDGPGSELDGVHTLRDIDDAITLRATLAEARHLLIVGAGFIGCEVASSARAMGVDVTLIDIADHPLLPFGPQLGERWLRMHRDNGVVARLGVGLAGLSGEQRVEGAELTDGTRLEVDAVLFALGSVLNTDWLAGSDLELNPGVVCDATLTTTRGQDILAAGDIAAVPVAVADGALLRVEHWTTAAEHGQLAGRNALLEPAERVAHTTPPYFWSDQCGTKIQAIGCPALAERIEVLEQATEADRFVAACVRGERVVGFVAVNAARRLAWYRRQLTDPVTLAEVQLRLSDEDTTLGSPAGVVA